MSELEERFAQARKENERPVPNLMLESLPVAGMGKKTTTCRPIVA